MSMVPILPTPKRSFFTGRWLEIATIAGGMAIRAHGIDPQRLTGVFGPCHESSEPQLVVRMYHGLNEVARRAFDEGKLPLNWLKWEREGYLLTIHSADGVPVITIAAKDARGEFYALQTLGQLVQRHGQTVRLPIVQVADWPDFAQRGVIEGFYGLPWSHRERLNMIKFCGQNKLNVFFYAPKDDPYHRTQWREPYPAGKLAELVELIDACHQYQVDFVFSVSPGNGMRFGGDEDFALLTAKMDDLFDHGVRHFSLLLDDIDPRLAFAEDRAQFESAAQAQAYVANRLLEHLRAKDPARSLTICPTE
ncbi:MAG: beta-N-acetylglucosaminidase domain-containing protein, partial [Bacillota bacterium]